MKLSKRLSSLVKYINKDDSVADIGCDHAYLDIYLILNNKVDKALVSDINIGAINNGIKNIKRYHLEDKIKAVCADGISKIDEDINTLVISGMGSSTIIKILSDKKLSQINKLIIQSNNDYYLLRKEICKLGFYITNESYIIDNEKNYVNIVFARGIKKYSELDLKYGPILINGNKEYFNLLLEKEENILKNIPEENKNDRTKIMKNIEELRGILNV